MLNITSSMLPEEIVKIAHYGTAVPSLIIAFIAASLIFLLIGLLILTNADARSKYFKIWGFSVSLSGVVFVWIALSPMTIQAIKDFISSLW